MTRGWDGWTLDRFLGGHRLRPKFPDDMSSWQPRVAIERIFADDFDPTTLGGWRA